MKKLLLVFLLLIQFVILPQNNFIRQITSGDFDAKNVFQPRVPFQPFIFYELHQGNSSNIVLISYNALTDDFSDTLMITSDNFQNINPVAGDGIIAFQTNRNGNWDIAYRKNINGVWGNIEYIVNSSFNEVNPKRVYSSSGGFDSDFFVLYQKGDTVFFSKFNQNSFTNEAVLISNAQNQYSEYTGVSYYNWSGGYPRAGYHIMAIESNSTGTKKIISRYRATNGDWENLNTIVDSCDCENPAIQFVEWEPYLIYEDIINSLKRLFKIYEWELDKSKDTIPINYNGDLKNFNSDLPHIITLEEHINKTNDNLFIPHTYFIADSNSLSVRLNIEDTGWFINDTTVNVKYLDSHLDIGNLAFALGGEIFYTIWEDSSDGHIHLFGRKYVFPVSAVEDESYANDFVLYQNYPNPFNPSTKIEYKLLQASDIKFNVFNVLGEKVFEQNYGYQTAGITK